jgi:hypothetical protein
MDNSGDGGDNMILNLLWCGGDYDIKFIMLMVLVMMMIMILNVLWWW